MYRTPDYTPRIRRFERLNDKLRRHIGRRLSRAQEKGEAKWYFPPNPYNLCSNPYSAEVKLWEKKPKQGEEGWVFWNPVAMGALLRWQELREFLQSETERMRESNKTR